MSDLLEKAVPSLLGTFVGAILAFASAAFQRSRERKLKRFEAMLETQAVLLSHRNSLLLHRTRMLESLEKSGKPEGTNPFDNLKKILLSFSERRIDFRQLGFLGSSADPQLLLDLEVAEDGLRLLVSNLALRNELIGRYLDSPKTEVTPIANTKNLVHTKGDPQAIAEMKYVNEFVFFAMNQSIENNGKAMDRFFALAMELYGGRQLFFGPRVRFPYIKEVQIPPPADQEG